MATAANRVSAQTSDEINRRLRWQMEERLAYYEAHTDQIETRLAELDREWESANARGECFHICLHGKQQ
ncbi:hypothetical protein [Rhizobium sullae]|uniref:Uncharacterized protein n=1 Tax=Rhizobium sullae TaxID=50338 RepID=A0A4R3PSG0_RHISU|nr:hypothetical protein [Rhizobium sullae]TCU05353.1 hypothetical protein EV132_13614 [Rhizobium sullae]